MSDDTEDRIREALANPRNQGEMADADASGTVGSPDCGDMVRMWLKFRDENGEKIIDKASFQSFGCQTAIAVASVATEMLTGKPVAEALEMDASDLSKPLGPLPPMKIHCGQMVEGALRKALEEDEKEGSEPATSDAPDTRSDAGGGNLVEALRAKAPKAGKVKIVKLD